MKHRFGLTARFIGLIIILLTAIFTIIASVLISTDTGSLRQELSSRSQAFATLATKPIGDTYATYQDSGTVLITQQVVSFTKLDTTISNVFVVDLQGNVKYSLVKNTKSIPASQAASFNPVYQYSSDKAITRIIYPYIDDSGSHQFAVVYDVSSSEVAAAIHKLMVSIIIYSLAGLVISAIATYVSINMLFLVPIKKLRDQALVISGGYYAEQITVIRHDEIGDLAGSVKQMAESLKDDIMKLQEVDKIKSEFMMIASHNLRTPLTIIDGYLELAETENLSDDLKRIFKNIQTNSKRLKIFAEDLLIISSVEAGQKIFAMENVNVREMLQLIATDFMPSAAAKKVTFTTSFDTVSVNIQGSSVHLRNAIYNLLDNALKFTPEGGTIELNAIVSGEILRISILDNGAGIAPEEIGKLFTKFHRGTSTLEYNYEGSGIGLYLTKLIITEHRGTIDVASTLGKGSTFSISLPLQ